MLVQPVLAHPPITVFVDGNQLSFDQPPVIIEDRTLVPMRGIFQALGCSIVWSEPTQTVTAIDGTDVLTLKIGDRGLYKNGELIYTMPVPAQIINDRTLVPIRAVSEALGAQVAWDGTDYIVEIFAKTTGTASGVQTGGYSTTVKAPDGTTVLTVKLTAPTLSGANAEAINTATATTAFKLGAGFAQEYGQAAKDAYEQAKADGDGFTPYYYVGSYDATRKDSDYVSFYVTTTEFSGAVDGIRDCFSYTYSRQTGKELALSQVITDSIDEMTYFWRVTFESLIDQSPDSFYNDAKTRLGKHMDDIGFYLTEEGVGFYLAPNIIAPNETGILSFWVQYEL